MKIKTKNLLTLAELTPKEFLGLIDHSIKLKKELKKGGNKPVLKNKTPVSYTHLTLPTICSV